MVGIYPGSFDPMTNGHLDLISRECRLVDRLIVAILRNETKAAAVLGGRAHVDAPRGGRGPVPQCRGRVLRRLAGGLRAARGANLIFRGIRAISDYEYELQMALMNRRLRPEIETVFLMAGEAYSFISSRLVKEVRAGRQHRRPGSPSVEERLKQRMSMKRTVRRNITMQLAVIKTNRGTNLEISVSSTMKVAADADSLRREGVDVVDFGAGEPDFPRPTTSSRRPSAPSNRTSQVHRRGRHAGTEAGHLRAACQADFGTNYKPAECIVTVGGKHAIFNLMQVLVDPGDEVIIPVPYWVTYKDVVNYAGGKCVFVETDEAKGFTLTAAMVEPHLTPRTQDDDHQLAVESERRGDRPGGIREDLPADVDARHLADDGRVLLPIPV